MSFVRLRDFVLKPSDDMIKTVGVVGAGTMGQRDRAGVCAGRLRRAARRRRAADARSRRDDDREEPRRSSSRRASWPPPIATRRSAGSRTSTTLDHLADADYVVEAIVENADAKRDAVRAARRDHAART